MDITEVRIILADEPARRGHPRVVAYATITLGGAFAVNDVKLMDGGRDLFLAMPAKRIGDRCPGCETKNHLRARFCNHCGIRLADGRARVGPDGREKLFFDLAHPIDQAARRRVEDAVIAAYLDAEEARRATPAAAGNFRRLITREAS